MNTQDKLAEALRELFSKWLESRPAFRTTVEVNAAWEGWKANTAVAAMLNALAAQAQAHGGEWVMVPREPTKAMRESAASYGGRGGYNKQRGDEAMEVWRDMLATAPQLHPAEPVAWRTFDGEGNYDYRDYENNEHYRDWYVSRNGAKYANWVEPLYSHPASADAKRLEEQRDDAFQQAVQEARRVWMDEFPCEAGHDHVTPFDQFLYGNRPCMEAQPPAVSVTDGFLRHVAAVCMGAVENCRPKASLIPEDPQEHNGGLCLNELTHIAGEIDRMLAAQESPNG